MHGTLFHPRELLTSLMMTFRDAYKYERYICAVFWYFLVALFDILCFLLLTYNIGFYFKDTKHSNHPDMQFCLNVI